MSNTWLPGGASPIEAISPTDSLSTLFTKYGSPTEKLIYHSSQSLQTKPWPTRPQRLHKGIKGFRWWESALDLVMIMLPVPFFILAASVVAVNGRVVDPREFAILDHSIKGATTLFPIFFSAVIGRAAVKYATWKLEQGTTIGNLEQLMGSRTVASAFATQLQLRSFNNIGLLLICIWSLSPIGAQSILHILYTPLQATSIVSTASYVNSRQQSYANPDPQQSFEQQWFPALAFEMVSSMIASTSVKESTMDTNSNVKIPFQSSVLAGGIPPDSEGWVQTSSMNATANGTLIWSSLFGIPVEGLGLGNTTFSMESTYIELTCTNKTFELNTTYVSTEGPYFSSSDTAVNDPWNLGYRGVDVSTFNNTLLNGAPYVTPLSCPDCLNPVFANETIEAGTLAFQEIDGLGTGNSTTVFCNPYQRYVESEVFCIKTELTQQCAVIAQRPSVLPHMPSEVTYFNFPLVALGTSSLLRNITPIHAATNEIQNYIVYDPTDPVNVVDNDSSLLLSGPDLPTFLIDVDLRDIEARLGQILNAFIYGSTWLAANYLVGEPFNDNQATVVNGNNASFVPATRDDLVAMIQNQTAAFTVPGILTTHAQVYLCYFPWLGVFLFSTLVMFAGAVTGVAFSRMTIIPDYLGFVSSLAKESPWIRMPDIGVNMDGMDKARLVKEVKVRLGDISPNQGGHSDIGRLAFARLEETTKVQKDKLYV